MVEMVTELTVCRSAGEVRGGGGAGGGEDSGEGGLRSHCGCIPPLAHFIPDSLRESVPLFSEPIMRPNPAKAAKEAIIEEKRKQAAQRVREKGRREQRRKVRNQIDSTTPYCCGSYCLFEYPFEKRCKVRTPPPWPRSWASFSLL